MKCYGQYSFLLILFLKYLLPVFIFFVCLKLFRRKVGLITGPDLQQSGLYFLFKYPRISLLVLSSIISPQMFHQHLMVWNFAEKRVD